MKVVIECPYCESRLEIALSLAQSKVKCQLCKNEFDAATNQVRAVAPLEKPTPALGAQPPVARPVSSSPPIAKVVEASPQVAPEVQDLGAAESPTFSTGITRSTITRARLKRKRSPLIPIIMGLTVLASAIALVVVLSNIESGKKQVAQNDTVKGDDEKEGESEQEVSAELPGSDSKQEVRAKTLANAKTESSIFRDNGVSDTVVEPPTNAPPDKPPKLSVYSYFSLEDIERFWRANSNFVVRLKVDLGSTSHYVSGIIVDRRGWVATSLAGVQNAKEIEVQIASDNLRAFGGIRLNSTDSVQGVLAKDPEHDLVLLAINRELVRSLSEVPIGSTDSLVEGAHLIQCAAPGKENFAWPNEVRFSRRQKYEDLYFDFKTQVDDQKYNRELDYIFHNGYSDTCVGAPLLDQKGMLFGINSSINDRSSKVMVIPAEAIKALAASEVDDVMGLSTLAK